MGVSGGRKYWVVFVCVFRTNVCARVSLFDYQLALLSMCAILIGSSRAVKDFGNFSRILRKFIGIEKPVLIELDLFSLG